MNGWINKERDRFIKLNKDTKTIYFLYEFLGDGFKITQNNFIDNLILWNSLNPDWNIIIIRNKYDKVDNLVEHYFPNYFKMYQNYPKNIQRCDIFRYMLMYLYGGVYSDLDVKNMIDLNSITNHFSHNGKIIDLSWANVIFGIARIKDKKKCKLAQKYESIRQGEVEIPYKLSNYFFISKINRHPIWLDILNLALKRSHHKVKSQYGIIYSTGPDLVTTAVSRNRKKYNDVAVLPLDVFNKIVKHQCASSWRKKNFNQCETNINTT